MIDVTARYLGLTLKSPLVASASPLCESVDNLQTHGGCGDRSRSTSLFL